MGDNDTYGRELRSVFRRRAANRAAAARLELEDRCARAEGGSRGEIGINGLIIGG